MSGVGVLRGDVGIRRLVIGSKAKGSTRRVVGAAKYRVH